ncbi:DEAD/DEAH box helicase [Microbacterium sp. gxy059]|uniref:DEAD/DEAH box helicase n=1 Tax=Microbacterium sp. gxy059 TaxID=2957199 RepID=UPI003D9863DF
MTSSLLEAARAAGDDADALYDAFLEWTLERGIELYPAQDEALMELVSGSNVILATPTGTGKSLVAIAAHAIAIGRGGRTYYTAPIKALVSEKFFALVETFGAENVGMVTGDSSVNADAPIVCCTAEILANLALREGEAADVDQVVMDEFHYYGDRDRGWGWQIPLLLLPRAQFLLMSATLGDTTRIEDDLTRRTGRATTLVAGAERPVPLHFSYEKRPAHEVVTELLDENEVPVYIVHFSQAAAMERAQSLASIAVASRAQRDEIAEALGDFRFTTSFGKTLSRLVRAGIGVHHAGMLPRYRRLVETLAQRGLLRVICGTDTLGVGINVPIRTVLVTALSKYDGTRMRRLGAREFHQIAGRAGRAGYDPYGNVIVLAPEHEIENEQARKKAGDDPKKLKKVQKKQAPKGFVSWSEQTFENIIEADPEPLAPQMQMTSAMLINVIARGGDVFANVRSLVFDNHQPPREQYALARRALAIFRTLRDAGLVEVRGSDIRLVVDLQPNFALNQPLSPFALAALELLDPDEGPGAVGTGSYALDVVSVVEATLDDPRAILSQQEFKARGEAVGAMKREGIEYDERMELLEEITYQKPLDELLQQAFETFASSQPWVRDFRLSPKSVVRDMYERAMTFAEFVQWYQLGRSEGLVLRYLSDAFRTIRQTVPPEARTPELEDIVEWLGEMVRQVDSSLVDEWETLIAGLDADPADGPVVPPSPPSVVKNRRAFTVLVRNAMFRRVQLAALERDDELADLDPDAGWPEALDAFYAEHDEILTGAAARSPQLCRIDESDRDVWRVEQTIDDPAGDHDWRIRAEVDLAASADEGEAVVRVSEVVRL